MSIDEFIEQTGWPRDEFDALNLSQVEELFGFYDMKFEIVIPARLFVDIVLAVPMDKLVQLGMYNDALLDMLDEVRADA